MCNEWLKAATEMKRPLAVVILGQSFQYVDQMAP